MDEVICRCGYRGKRMVEFEVPYFHKSLVEWGYGSYFNPVPSNYNDYEKPPINWACPECGRILVHYKEGRDYNNKQFEIMQKRLWHHNFEVKRWLKSQKIKS